MGVNATRAGTHAPEISLSVISAPGAAQDRRPPRAPPEQDQDPFPWHR